MIMEKYVYDEKNGLWYELEGDYYIPMLMLDEDEVPDYGKYGMLRETYLKECCPAMYKQLFLHGKLTAHLNRVDREACEKVDMLVRQMAAEQGVTEQLKAENQMLWVGKMNNIRHSAEEIVREEVMEER